MKQVVLASAFLLSVNSLQAAENIRWDKVSLSYQSTKFDDSRFSGLGVAGTTLINEDFFVSGLYSTVSEEITLFDTEYDLDVNRTSLGLGYRHALSDKTDFFTIVAYENYGVDISRKSSYFEVEDSNGHSLEAGIRTALSEKFELMASLNHIDVSGESETGINASLTYHLDDQFSANIGFEKIDDQQTVFFSGVYFF